MKKSIATLTFIIATSCCLNGQTITAFSEDFEGAVDGATAGTNATIPGTSMQAANTMIGTVVDLTLPANAALAAAFTSGSGNVLELSPGGGAFSTLRSAGVVNNFGTVFSNGTYVVSYDIYVPASITLTEPIGDIQPRLEIQGTSGNGPTLNPSPLVDQPGVYAVSFSGDVSDIINPPPADPVNDPPTSANSVFPHIGFDQTNTTDQTLSFPGIAYIDNIRIEITPDATAIPVINQFALGESGVNSGETVGYLCTTGDDTADGVFTPTGREFYYDVDGVTSVTLKRDGTTVQTVAVTSPASGVITTDVPSTPGVYVYTLEATDGTDVVNAGNDVTVSVDQQFVVNQLDSNGGPEGASAETDGSTLISAISTLRINYDVVGDYDFNDLSIIPVDVQFSLAGFANPAPIADVFSATPLTSAGTLFFSDNFNGRTAWNVADIIDAVSLANGGATVTYPIALTTAFTFDNGKGSAVSQSIVVTVEDDCNTFAEIDPANLNLIDGTIPNTYSDLFEGATDADSVGNFDNSVSFTDIIIGTTFLGGNGNQIGAGGFLDTDVSISLWLEVLPEATGNVILDLGGVGVEGTTLGYDAGMLKALMQQDAVSEASTVSVAISEGWHHVVLLLDVTNNQISLALDGVLTAGNVSATDITSWQGGFGSATVFGTQLNGYSGQNRTPSFLPSGSGFDGSLGHLRAYSGLIDSAKITQLNDEFRVAGAGGIEVTDCGFNGASFEVSVSGLTTGTDYFLVRTTTGLDMPFTTVGSAQTATGPTDTFQDPSPPASGQAFYRVTDTP